MNRSELLFLYDITDANPNGDPLDENKPRIDEENGRNLVTDVRLKRTIRDYLHDFKEQEIFVREIRDEDDNVQDAKLRAEDFLFDSDGKKLDKAKMTIAQMKETIGNNVLAQCIDVRLFGATIPLEKKDKKQKKTEDENEENQKGKNTGSLTYTGPVQFKMGRSLHSVDLMHIKGTGAFASDKGKTQSTFREEYILPYSLIGFYGIINENAARTTQLGEADVDYLMEAMWNGTKNLISRSKAGQIPRLLLRVVYKGGNFHIGELDKCLSIVTTRRDEEIRDISEVKIEVSPLIQRFTDNANKIEKIEYIIDPRLMLLKDGQVFNISDGIAGISVVPLQFA